MWKQVGRETLSVPIFEWTCFVITRNWVIYRQLAKFHCHLSVIDEFMSAINMSCFENLNFFYVHSTADSGHHQKWLYMQRVNQRQEKQLFVSFNLFFLHNQPVCVNWNTIRKMFLNTCKWRKVCWWCANRDFLSAGILANNLRRRKNAIFSES